MIIYAVLGILLALSAAGNAYQYHQAGKLQVRIGTTKQLADDTKAAATACSAGVDRLETASTARQTALEKALKGIAPKVAALNAEALVASRAKPDDPKDLCGSLERYLKGQVKAERGLK